MKLILRDRALIPRNNIFVMGILNVTPDSFSDGGQFMAQDTILRQAEEMLQAGADIIDIGGESTRPFAEEVPTGDELQRVIPAINIIRSRYTVPISIDTTKAEVARQALDAGADIINDVSALRFDASMTEVAAGHDCPIILMHMQGEPRTMQLNPIYGDVIGDIVDFFTERLSWCDTHGINRNRVIIDPGLGFGKNLEHNLAIIKNIPAFSKLGCPVLIGHSRKSFIGKILDIDVDHRDTATAIISAYCVGAGASILRVHDVDKTVQAIKLTNAILASS